MFDLDFTGAFIDSRRKPVDAAVEKDDDISEHRYLIGSISTMRTWRNRKKTAYKLAFKTIIVKIIENYGKAICNNV